MPAAGVKSDYAEAKIYRLVGTGTDKCYIGSTCGTLERRMWHHNHCAKNPTQKQTAACWLYENCSTVTIELIEKYPCASKAELDARERYWIEATPTAINKNIPGRTWQERRAVNKEGWEEYMKEYRAIMITCECGKEIRKADNARHLRSAYHMKWLSSRSPAS